MNQYSAMRRNTEGISKAERDKQAVIKLLPGAYAWYSDGEWCIHKAPGDSAVIARAKKQGEAWIAALTALKQQKL